MNVLNFLARRAPHRRKSLEQWIEQSRSRNGYEREEAIHALRAWRDGLAIPCLLARANDWVPAVREAASLALDEFLCDEFAADWVAALGPFLALQGARRVKHDRILAAVSGLLGRPQHLPLLLSASEGAGPAAQRFVFALRYQQIEADAARMHLLLEALGGAERSVAKLAMNLASSDKADGVARVACRSRFPELRAAGLRGLLAAGSESSHELALELCLDPNGSVRNLALFALRSWGKEHLVLDLALAQLNCPELPARKKAAALQHLGHLDSDKARAFAAEALASASGYLRSVAYSQLLNTDNEDVKDSLLLRALADESGRVQGLALERIQRGLLPPNIEDVLRIALRFDSESALRRRVSLFSYYSYWARLIALLRGLEAHASLVVKSVWLQALDRWEREGVRCFIMPSPAQQDQIKNLWNRCGPLMSPSLVQHMRFHLTTYGIDSGGTNKSIGDATRAN